MKPLAPVLLRLALGLILVGGSAATAPRRPSHSLLVLGQTVQREVANAWQQVLACAFTTEHD